MRVPGKVVMEGSAGMMPICFICTGLSHDKQANRSGFLMPAASSAEFPGSACVLGRAFT